MKINHINITVNDVKTTRAFFEKYFDLVCIGSAGNMFAAMNDEDGFLFNLIEGKILTTQIHSILVSRKKVKKKWIVYTKF